MRNDAFVELTKMLIKTHHTDFKEELANAITHGLGLVFGLIAIPLLILFSVRNGSPAAVTGASIYGFSFLMVFFSSTLYHSIHQPQVKHIMQIVDHISIFFLIAGSYTPFILLYIFNPAGITVLSVLWALALIGIFYKIFFIGRFKRLSLFVYLLMGWMLIVIAKPFFTSLPVPNSIMVIVGGVLYTLGTIFYAWKRIPYHHAIWHLFVLAASICHYVAVWLSLG